MLDIETILLFGVASFVLCATPGPDMLLVAARSAAQGRLAGIVTQLGVTCGSLVHALILALGLSQLFLAVPYAYDLVRYLGAAYLLYLAWQALRSHDSFAPPSGSSRPLSMHVVFRQGFLTNLLNPKVALFYLALFPQFLDPDRGAFAVQIMLLALILQIVDFGVHAVVIWLAGGIRTLAAGRNSFLRWSRYFLALVFGGLAARLVVDAQR